MVPTAKIRCTIKPEVKHEATRFGGLGDSVFGGWHLGSQGRPASSGGMYARITLCEVKFGAEKAFRSAIALIVPQCWRKLADTMEALTRGTQNVLPLGPISLGGVA